MKINVSIGVLVVVASLVGSATEVRAQIGFAGGLNYAQFGDINFGSAEASVDNASGYHVGIFFDLAAGPVAIRPGLFFRNVKDISYEIDAGSSGVNYDLNLIDVPVDLRLRLPAPLLSPYLLAGPVVTFASSSDEDFGDSIENLLFSGNIGAGLELHVPILGVTLFPEVRYAFGLSPLVKEFEFLGASFQAEDGNQRMNSIMLRLGIAL